MLKKIVELVQSQKYCVLATTDGERPHASLMAFCAAPDCSEFWLASLMQTRKYKNLSAAPRASLLFDDRTGGRTGGFVDPGPRQALTVEAELAAFAAPEDAQLARAALLDRHPALADFLALDGCVVLRLRALRYQLLGGLTDLETLEAGKKA